MRGKTQEWLIDAGCSLFSLALIHSTTELKKPSRLSLNKLANFRLYRDITSKHTNIQY